MPATGRSLVDERLQQGCPHISWPQLHWHCSLLCANQLCKPVEKEEKRGESTPEKNPSGHGHPRRNAVLLPRLATSFPRHAAALTTCTPDTTHTACARPWSFPHSVGTRRPIMGRLVAGLALALVAVLSHPAAAHRQSRDVWEEDWERRERGERLAPLPPTTFGGKPCV